MLKNQHPQYLFNLIAIRHSLFNTRNATNLHFFNTKHSFFKNSFFPSNIIKWNNLDITLHNSRNLFIFKKHILQFIRPSSNSLYNSHNPKGIKLMTRFFLDLCHLQENKFKRSFQDSINPLWNCGYDVESTVHFFFHCPLFTNERSTLFSTLHNIDSKLFDNTDSLLTNIFLLGKKSLDTDQNTAILNATMGFILAT